jgi:hypothetical protein
MERHSAYMVLAADVWGNAQAHGLAEQCLFHPDLWDESEGKFHIPWYDDFSEPGGVMFIGRDFGLVEHAKAQKAQRKSDASWMPGLNDDYSYVQMRLVADELASFAMNNLYFANTLYFLRPENASVSGNFGPLEKSCWEQSKHFLSKEITQICKPKIIVPLGDVPTDRILRLFGFNDVYANLSDIVLTPLEKDGYTILPSWHPANWEMFQGGYIARLSQTIRDIAHATSER